MRAAAFAPEVARLLGIDRSSVRFHQHVLGGGYGRRGGPQRECGMPGYRVVGLDIIGFNKDAATVTVQPGLVLDHLNAWLKPHGLWFPVDVSTSAQATIGGMTGNNSCGSRSIFYGNMVHNVRGVDAVLADGNEYHFGAAPSDLSQVDGPQGYRDLVRKIRDIAVLNADYAETTAGVQINRFCASGLEACNMAAAQVMVSSTPP